MMFFKSSKLTLLALLLGFSCLNTLGSAQTDSQAKPITGEVVNSKNGIQKHSRKSEKIIQTMAPSWVSSVLNIISWPAGLLFSIILYIVSQISDLFSPSLAKRVKTLNELNIWSYGRTIKLTSLPTSTAWDFIISFYIYIVASIIIFSCALWVGLIFRPDSTGPWWVYPFAGSILFKTPLLFYLYFYQIVNDFEIVA